MERKKLKLIKYFERHLRRLVRSKTNLFFNATQSDSDSDNEVSLSSELVSCILK